MQPDSKKAIRIELPPGGECGQTEGASPSQKTATNH